MQVIALQAISKQNFSAVLDDILFEMDLIETAGCMSCNITRAGTVVVSGARCVAGQLLINYESLEAGDGNFMFLTNAGDLPFYDQFTTTQTLLFASNAELAAVRP
jgi:hypothetical protein